MNIDQAHALVRRIEAEEPNLACHSIDDSTPWFVVVTMKNTRTNVLLDFMSERHFTNWRRGQRLVMALIGDLA